LLLPVLLLARDQLHCLHLLQQPVLLLLVQLVLQLLLLLP
jgi:hypothetical protein